MKINQLPDVALETLEKNMHPLDLVGMSNIEIPLRVPTTEGEMSVTALVEAGVSLTSPVKGVHMSRIYTAVTETLTKHIFSFSMLENLMKRMLDSHQGISDCSRVTLSFTYRSFRRSLLTDNEGWRNYPIEISATYREGEFCVDLSATVTYSSTCPCSAALSRQLIQQKFMKDFGPDAALDRDMMAQWLGQESNICATPHSQRSYAIVSVGLENPLEMKGDCFLPFIDGIENALQTAVQAAVKREDEQEFARLNAAHLMFSEDSARRLKSWLENDYKAHVKNHHVRVEHHESLHEHDAIAEFYG